MNNPELRPKIPLINLQNPGSGRNKSLLIKVLIALVVLGGIGFYFYKKSGKGSTQSEKSAEQTATAAVTTTPVVSNTAPVASTPPVPVAHNTTSNISSAPVSLVVPLTTNAPAAVSAMPSTETVSNVVQVIHSGPTDQKRVALTFDDGPHATITSKVLDTLRTNQVKATFFVLGNMVKKNPKVLAQVAAEGHEIGNHTYSHKQLPGMATNQVQYELSETQQLIKNATGIEANYFRPPFGMYRASIKPLLLENKLNTIVLWSIDPEDWKVRDSERVFNAITNKIHNGSIIVCHDIYPTTLNMLSKLIYVLKSEGYELVTVSQLCNIPTTTKPVSAPSPVVTITNVVTVTNSVVVPNK